MQIAGFVLRMRWTTARVAPYVPAVTNTLGQCAPSEAGRDAFCRVPDFAAKEWDAVERDSTGLKGSALGVLVCLLAMATSLWAQAPAASPANGEATQATSLQILDPRSETTSTTREVMHVLGRTPPDATVTVGGEAARVFSTGVFVRDNVPLQMGENRIVVVATTREGQKLEAGGNREARRRTAPRA